MQDFLIHPQRVRAPVNNWDRLKPVIFSTKNNSSMSSVVHITNQSSEGINSTVPFFRWCYRYTINFRETSSAWVTPQGSKRAPPQPLDLWLIRPRKKKIWGSQNPQEEQKNTAGYCTLQGINISHLGKRKIIFKMPFLMGYVSFLEGIHFFSVWSSK